MKSQKKMTVYFVPITHHDLGFTHTIDDLFKAFCSYYDSVLDFCDKTDAYPDESKYRYTVEQFWSLDYYLSTTTDRNRERMKKRVREGRIELPAFYANIIDCISGNEELIRMMYPSFKYADECGVKIKRAALTDIPGMSGGISDILAQAGVKYLFAGFPRYFEWADATGKVPEMKHSYWSEEFGRHSAFNWLSKSGDKVLTWFQSGYGWFGNDENPCIAIDSIDDLLNNLPKFVNELYERNYKYDVVRYIYRGSDNEMPSADICDIVNEWNEKHSDIGITLKVATETMFFEALEKQVGNIPELSGEIPHTDYTVLSLTEAEMTATNKRARVRCDSAERLGGKGGTDIFKDIILYDEHCFGMLVPIGEEQELNRPMKMKYALRAALSSKRLLDSAVNETALENSDGTISFFSPSGKASDQIASFLTQKYGAGRYVLENIKNGNKTYGNVVDVNDPLIPMVGLTELYSSTICSGGIKRAYFDIGKAEPMSFNTYKVTKLDSEFKPVGFENGFYRFDPEALTVFDKESGRYITDPSAEYPFGTVLTRDIRDGSVHGAKTLSVGKSFESEAATAYLIRSSVYGAPEVITEIILYHGIKRIDVSVRAVLDRTPFKEIYVSFPFLESSPEFIYQGVNFIGKAFDNNTSGINANHYTVQNYVKVSGESGDSVLSMAEGGTVCFGGLHVTEVSQAHHMINPVGFEDELVTADKINNGHVYVMLAYNNCRTNFAMVQQGEILTRFSLTSGNNSDEAAFSEGFVYSPILLGEDKSVAYSHIKPSADNVYIQHIKPAEDGHGIIVRLRETKGKNTEFSLDIMGASYNAEQCDILERKIGTADLDSLSVKPFGLINLRLTEVK